MNWNNVSLRRPALKNADPGEKNYRKGCKTSYIKSTKFDILVYNFFASTADAIIHNCS